MSQRFIATFYILMLTWGTLWAQAPQAVHDNVRNTPYPQQGNALYINPAPLIVPMDMKKSYYLQFNLSRYENFSGSETILSKPVRWNIFNAHQELENGTWYWRFRSVTKQGEELAWSKTYSFTVTSDVPKFVTPSVDKFLNNIPSEFPRMYPYFKETAAI